ncbi:NAD(P)H-dependent oxidoreductase [Micromonospora sp. NPDC050200]|uniref:NADPH-dependent FMN reductase n=1 Tax=Micromonospora sp. NPDC050200 TaxID=3155664 RepID=UPI0033EC5563
MPQDTRILLVPGSTRAGSTNTAALRTAHALAVPGVATTLHDALRELPAFDPDQVDAPPAPVVALRAALAAADAVLFCTPEYAGTLPGSFKNLLDWTVGNGDLYGKPVAWVTVAAPGRGGGAEQTLRMVLGYLNAEIVEPACVRLPLPRDGAGADGLLADAELRAGLADVLVQLGAHVDRAAAVPASGPPTRP